ncbi:MAG: type II secretion system F family protein [Aquificae bacterium]|nr:type II secretion system F family protein [Aquificota bacterium]
MRSFVYEGIKEGKRVRGVARARDRGELFRKLRQEGIKPVRIEEKRERGFSLFRPRVSEEEVAFVLLQLWTLLSSGIPLTRALELVASQTENEVLAGALIQVKLSVERGESLAQAFRKTGVFPEFLSEMLGAVQRGENLEFVFKIAGEYLQKVAEFKSRVISSVTYPLVVILFSFVSLFVAVKFVVPRIASVLESFGKELPLITRLILLFSDVLTFFLLLVPVVFLVFRFRERFVSRETLHRLLLRVPVLGKLNLYFNLSRFARVLAMLLGVSVPLPEALRLAASSVSNEYLKRRLLDIVSELERGKSLSSLLRRIKEIPELFVNLVETGEASGELARMLELLADVYEKSAQRVINFWLRFIEPLSILIIGITVGIIALSVLLPLTEITSGLR